MVELTSLTRAHVLALFRATDVDAAERLLVESCGSNLPLMSNDRARGLERIRFAAIRFSGGRMDELREAIQLAQCDWRDLLVGAGFAEDIHAHSRWNPARFDTEVSDRWMAGENPTGVSFSLNQVVHLRDFPGATGPGAVIGLIGLEPEPKYVVELGAGGDVEVFQRFLRSAD